MHRHCIEADVMRTEKEICYLIRQICEAVRYLHDEKIVHLDLKVSKDEFTMNECTCKLFQFEDEVIRGSPELSSN